MTPKKPFEESHSTNPLKKNKGIKYLTIFSLISLVLIITIVVWKIRRNIKEVYPPLETNNEVKQSIPASQDLIGHWRRTDGGYVIEIRAVNTQGILDASYYNPKPINVSRGEVNNQGGMLGIFLELWDEGYPGSTYELTYDPIRNLLYGTYYTPVAGQSFEVIFTRVENQ